MNSILDLLTSPSIKCLYILTKITLYSRGWFYNSYLCWFFFLIISSYFWWDLFFRDISSHSHPSQPFSSRGVLSCSGHYWPLHTDIVCGTIRTVWISTLIWTSDHLHCWIVDQISSCIHHTHIHSIGEYVYLTLAHLGHFRAF